MTGQPGRVKEFFKKYGKVGVGVHFTVYFSTLAGCYFAAERKVKLEHLLIKYHLLSEDELRSDAKPEERSWLAKALTSSGSSLAIAFLCTKALAPVRIPITFAVTPMLARYLQRSTAQGSAAACKAAGEAAASMPRKSSAGQ